MNTNMPRYLPYLICTLASMFYLYEFVLQVSPSVMTHQLMKDFGIGAVGVSVISAFYYYSYTPMQIIAGLLYDRFGPRKVLTTAILICSLGTFFFSLTHSVAMASLGRFLMGIGSAFSFIGALLLISRWFPTRHFALIAGIVQLMSAVGAISGQIPIAAVVDNFGWRSTMFWIACIGIVLAFLILLLVKDYPPNISIPASSQKGELSRLHAVFGKSQTWFVGLYAFASWGPIVIFGALWGIPYLVERYHVSTTVASGACAMIWLGIGVGCPLFGWWSDSLKTRRFPMIVCALLALFSSIGILYAPYVSFTWIYFLLFIFGLAASGQALSFAVVKDRNSNSVLGTAMGLNNMLVVLGGAILQPLAGLILRHCWNGKYNDGTPFYASHDYILAMSIIPVCAVLALAMSLFFIKETHCRHVHES
jgi:MFS family permease